MYPWGRFFSPYPPLTTLAAKQPELPFRRDDGDDVGQMRPPGPRALLDAKQSITFGEADSILGELAAHAGPGGDGRERQGTETAITALITNNPHYRRFPDREAGRDRWR